MSIPYRSKKIPLEVALAEGNPMGYRSGTLRLETEPVSFRISRIEDTRTINIMDLGGTDMLIGYDWLEKHNPAID
jgi:hypothetical protein